jgi:peptidoglycan/xylan/chitin deacetylase (PgdA/CDA1 family)
MEKADSTDVQQARWEKRAANLAIQAGMLEGLEKLEANRKDILRILAYHRIGYQKEAHGQYDPSLISATPEAFAKQMEYLMEHYNVLSLESLLCYIDSRTSLPPRSVLITFDDAYRDFLDYAWPVLKDHRIPTVLFAPTGYLDGGRLFWWDLLHRAIFQPTAFGLSLPLEGEWELGTEQQRITAFEDLKQRIQSYDNRHAMRLLKKVLQKLALPEPLDNPILTWEEIRYLDAQGVYIAAHTQSHPILSRVSLEEAHLEVTRSQADLLANLGHTWPVFAFPVGHMPHIRGNLVSILAGSGFKLAVTMVEGHNLMLRSNPLLLKRVGMAPHLSMEEFRLILTRFYNLYGMIQKIRGKMREDESKPGRY